MKFGIGAAAVILAAFSLTSPLWAAPASERITEEGAALAADLAAQRPPHDSQFTGTLDIRSADGKRTRVPVRLRTILKDKEWRAIYETGNTDAPFLDQLTVIHTENAPNRYLKPTPAAKGDAPAEAELPRDQVMTPFAGSDFFAADLGLEFYHWPIQRLVKREMRRSRSCRVLESINPQPPPGFYSRVMSWIDNETDGLIRAEAYDRDNKLLKEFSVGSFKKVKGRWELQDMEIQNTQTDTKTRLEFNLGDKK